MEDILTKTGIGGFERLRKKYIMALLCLTIGAGLAAGCGKAETVDDSVALVTAAPSPTGTPTVTPSATPTSTPEETPTEAPKSESTLPEGQMYSYLTGEPIDTAAGSRRPIAIMINNLQPAVPQSGINQADLLYEIEVEGNITRLMAVFQDPSNIGKIGPVRSARPYFVYFAMDNEAVYSHYGWSQQAQDLITSQNMEDINGMTAGGFYRSEDRKAPHNVYVAGSSLTSDADSLGYNRAYPEGYAPNLAFNTTDTDISGEVANTVHIPFKYDDPYFVFNTEDRQYYRYEYGSEHIDQETGEQLKFKNIIVQYVSEWHLDDNVHLDMNLFTSGTGVFFTDGKAIPITWEKADQNDNTEYFDSNGNKIMLNPGKTMFEICSDKNSASWS